MPAIVASNNEEGSGTAAGLPPNSKSPAALLDAASDADANALPSTASRPETESVNGEVPLDVQTDEPGNAARMRSSNKLTSKPGSVAARRSIAAMRFSSCWPFALLIAPEAIAA